MTQRPTDALFSTGDPRALVIVAAGSGTRLGYGVPKAAVPLVGRSILSRALDAVTADLGLGLLVVVVPPDPSTQATRQQLVAEANAVEATGVRVVVVSGGSTRASSVNEGLAAVQEHARHHDWPAERTTVLIHDAARPLTPPEVFRRVLQAVESGAEAVVPAVPVTDTIKQVSAAGTDASAELEIVGSTPARSQLRAVQTPQGFTLDFLERALEHTTGLSDEEAAALTDEAMIAEHLGVEVAVVVGHPRALKITTETDLLTATALLQETHMPAAQVPLPRVGIGHDIHAFAPEDQPTELWLAGLHWPGQQGLSGHSDGDAVAHACCDALFSAAGLGDLGVHFGADTMGTSRPELAGASGVMLLAEAAAIVRRAGFRIGSLSVQFIGNRPKFGPRREEAQRALSAAAGAPVAVSATTADGLGFTGRAEGIMATATAVLVKD